MALDRKILISIKHQSSHDFKKNYKYLALYFIQRPKYTALKLDNELTLSILSCN